MNAKRTKSTDRIWEPMDFWGTKRVQAAQIEGATDLAIMMNLSEVAAIFKHKRLASK